MTMLCSASTCSRLLQHHLIAMLLVAMSRCIEASVGAQDQLRLFWECSWFLRNWRLPNHTLLDDRTEIVLPDHELARRAESVDGNGTGDGAPSLLMIPRTGARAHK